MMNNQIMSDQSDQVKQSQNNAPDWTAIEQHPDFQALDFATKKNARNKYFDSFIAPRDDFKALDTDTQALARTKWNDWTPLATMDQNEGLAGDLMTSVEKGVLDLPGMVTGLADLVPALTTGTRPFDKVTDAIGEATGFQPSKWSEELNKNYSQKYKQQQYEINQAWKDKNKTGWDVAAAYAKNPGYVLNQIAESLPSMAIGGFAGRGAMVAGKAVPALEGVTTKIAPEAIGYLERRFGKEAAAAIAGGLGEGLVQTGQSLDKATGQDQRKNAIAALISGTADALIAGTAGRIAQSIGLETADTLMAKGLQSNLKTELSLGKRAIGRTGKIAAGAASEGILQEFPQSAQEQIWQNYADGKPLFEDVSKASVEGALAGIFMGAGANAISTTSTSPDINTYEGQLQSHVDNIKSNGIDKIPASIDALNQKIDQNNQMMQNQETLDALAAESGYDVKDLQAYLEVENKFNQDLVSKLQEELSNSDETQSTETISEETIPIDEVINRRQSLDAAQQATLEKQKQDLDKRIEGMRNAYLKMPASNEKDSLGKTIVNLVNERKALDESNIQEDQLTGNTFNLTEDQSSSQANREDKQALYDELFGAVSVNKDAQESAKVMEQANVEAPNILGVVPGQHIANIERDKQLKNDLINSMQDVQNESDDRFATNQANKFEQESLKYRQWKNKPDDTEYARIQKIDKNKRTPWEKEYAATYEAYQQQFQEDKQVRIEARKTLTNHVFKNEQSDESVANTSQDESEVEINLDYLDDYFGDETVDPAQPVETTDIENPPITYTPKPGESQEEVNVNQVKLDQYAKDLKSAYIAGHLEIPQYMIALDLLARKDIKSIEQMLDSLSRISTNENDPQYAVNTSFRAKGKADLDRLIKMIGSQMYKGNLAEVTIKEVVQNSFDAVKASLNAKGKKRIEEGQIDIITDPRNRIIAIKDNGQGMTKKVLLDAFLTVAGTDKSGMVAGDASGGFGMAKAAFLYGNEWIEVVTRKNGREYSFKGTGSDIISKGIDIKSRKIDKDTHGTIIIIKVPEQVDVNGEKQYVWFPKNLHEISFFKQPLIHNKIAINLQQEYFSDLAIENLTNADSSLWNKEHFEVIKVGKNTDLSKYDKPVRINFDWGYADLYIGKERISNIWNVKHDILSAGVYQFEHPFQIAQFKKIPYNIILNIFPTTDADAPSYPFNVRREGWKDNIKKDVASLNAYVKNIALGIEAQETVDQFKNIQSLPRIDINDIGSNNVDLSDFFTKTEKDHNKKKISNIVRPSKITVSNGKVKDSSDKEKEVLLIDTNKKSDEKDLGSSFQTEKEAPKAKDFLLDVGIDDKQPIFHNNTSTDYFTFAKQHGYSAETFFAEFGSLILKVKDLFIDKNIHGYDDLKDNEQSFFFGTSIDKKYHGVNLVVPFKAILVNPLAIKQNTLPGIVHGLYDTFIHEFAHIPQRNHEEGFSEEVARLKTMLAADGTDLEIRVTLGRLIKKHKNLINLLRREYEESTTKNVAKSINDTDQSDALAARRFTNVSDGSTQTGNGKWLGAFQTREESEEDNRISTGNQTNERDVNLNIDDVKKLFPGQQVTQDDTGKISIRLKNGKGITFQSIQQVDSDLIKIAIDTGQMSKTGKILGITIGADILLNENFADDRTLWHENKHVLDNLGIITKEDNAALNKEFNKLRKQGKLEFTLSTHEDPIKRMEENRANLFAQIMTNREAYRGTTFGKIIQRVMDFFQQLLAFGKQTVSGLAQEVESGKIYERKINGKTVQTMVPQTEVTAKQWYSAVENAVKNFKQKQALPNQWKGMIKNIPGIKQDELDWIGLDEWLDKQKGKVTKDELLEFIQENNVQLEEVILHDFKELLTKELALLGYGVVEKHNQLSIITPQGDYVGLNDSNLPKSIRDTIDQIRRDDHSGTIQYGDYVIGERNNYKELVITGAPKTGSYVGEHFSEPGHTIKNPLVHIRIQTRTDINGKKHLNIEETQSDWHQDGRKQDYGPINLIVKGQSKTGFPIKKVFLLEERKEAEQYAKKIGGQIIENYSNTLRDNVPDAPFKKTWAMLAMKRMIRYAAENGFDSITWSPAKDQFSRWGSEGFQWKSNPDGSFTVYSTSYTASHKLDTDESFKKTIVKTKADLYKIVQDTFDYKQMDYSPEKWEKYVNNQTDILWKRMQEAKKTALTDLDDPKIFKALANAHFDYNFNNTDENYAKIVRIEEDYLKRLNKKLADHGFSNYYFNSDYDGWALINSSGSTIAKANSPQETFDQVFADGNYLPRLEGFKKFYDERLPRMLKREFGKNKWGKAKIEVINFTKPRYTVVYNGIELADFDNEKDALAELNDTKEKNPTADVKIEKVVSDQQLAMQITDRMRRKALREGMAMFKTKELSVPEQAVGGLLNKKTNINTPEFQQWFKGSLAVQKDGSPIEFYHGTDEVFDTFDPNKISKTTHTSSALGHFFTINKKTASSYGQHVLPVYLQIHKPYKMSFQEATSLKTLEESKQRQQELINQGYDSIVMETGTNPYVIVFDSSQVKSVYNQGDWKAADNIYFETREELEPKQKLSDAEYYERFKQKNNKIKNILQTVKIRAHDAKLLLDKLTTPISTRLANANPMLRDKIRRLDLNIMQKITDDLVLAKPLLDKIKDMSPEDRHAWDVARRQADGVKIQKIAERYGMTEDLNNLRGALDKIRQEAEDVGYDIGYIDEYWPRIIKDVEGFLQATQGISQHPDFTDALKEKAKQMGISVEELNSEFPEIRADVISNLILGQSAGIGGPGNIKSRVYDIVPKELEKYYMNSDSALMQYIYSMRKKIEARKFFGKIPPRIQKHKLAVAKAKAELLQLQHLKGQDKRINELNDLIALHEEKLNQYKNQRDFTENIGAYIDELLLTGKLRKEDERPVRQMLNARFNEHGTTGFVNAYKNMAYMDVMGNPLSALTQIGDLAWAAYVGKIWTPKGFTRTTKNLIRATLNKSKMTKEELGLERIAQEFADSTTLGNAVSKVFKAVGLTKIDSIGKETLLNNALETYQDQVKTQAGLEKLRKQIRPTFGAETEQVLKDLATGKHSDNVKMLVYSRVLDFQPVALSEMPELYLNGGNGRIFYMLKTFTIKQIDIFRREIFHEITSGDPKRIAQGIKNMVALTSLLVLANAGADELKDLLTGRKTKFKDNVIENLLSLGGASRYMRMQVTREGIGSAALQQILPPVKFINSISSDITEKITTGDVSKGLRSIESIPSYGLLGGKLWYWHFGRGSKLKKSLAEKEFAKDKKRFKKFKKQFDESTDKRLFARTNSQEFRQMLLHNNIKKALTKNKATINKLKKLKQTPAVIKSLGQLEEYRKLIYQQYFNQMKKLQA